MLKVIPSNNEIATTPPQIAQFHSNMVQFQKVIGHTLQMFKVTT